MTISCTWGDFQTLYPHRGISVIFVKDANNDVPTIVVGMLEDVNKIFTITNPPSKNQFLNIYPNGIQVNSIT